MRLHIGNLPKTITDGELNDLIAAFAKPTSLEIIRDSAGTSKGFGFADFATDDDARAVIAGLNGKTVGENELKLGEARPRKPDARGPRQA